MEIYVGNIPSNSNIPYLEEFFKGFAKHAKFTIMRVKREHQLFVFGLVTIESSRIAKKAIKRLNLKRMDGRLIVVREYIHRVSNNDRRALNWRNKKWTGNERRKNERRSNRLPQSSKKVDFAA